MPKAPTVYPHTSSKPMSAAEYRHIRVNILNMTQVELRKNVVFKGYDRNSAYENSRSPVPRLVAYAMRLTVAYKQLTEELNQ